MGFNPDFPSSSNSSSVSIDMSGDSFWSSLGSGILNLLTGGGYGQAEANRINKDIAERNLDLQQEAFDYTKWLNAMSWARDDNAIQRRVKDLEAAGLNPLLAVGNAAGNSSPISVSAPQNRFSYQANKGNMSALIQQGLQMSQAFAGLENINARSDYTQAVTDNVVLQNDNINAQIAKKYMDLWSETYDMYVKGNVAGNDLLAVAKGIAGKFGIKLNLQDYASGDFYKLNSKIIEAIWAKYGSPLIGDSGLSGLQMGPSVPVADDQRPYESGQNYLLRRILAK